MNKHSTLYRFQRNRYRGQAMVEFVVTAMFFLVPLFLGMVAMAKFADVQHVTTMTARYAAWERTVWYDDAGTDFDNINASNHKSAAQIRNESAVRLINNRSTMTVIKDSDKNATQFVNGIDPMWRDSGTTAFLDSYDQQAATVTKTSPSTNFVNGAIEVITKLPLPDGVVGNLAPPVPTDTFAIAEVSLHKVAGKSDAYRRLWPDWVGNWTGLEFKATGAILSNTWYANGSAGTHDMVAESVPTAKGLGTVINGAVKATLLVWDKDVPNPEFGKISPDVVPADRLK